MRNNNSLILTNRFLCVQFDVHEFNIQIHMNKSILLTNFKQVIDILNNNSGRGTECHFPWLSCRKFKEYILSSF